MFTLKDNEALVALKKQFEAKKIKLKGIVKTTQRGFGFLESEDGSSAFIQKSLMYGLLPEMEIEATAEETDKGLSVSNILSVKSKGQTEFICKVETFNIDERVYANALPLRNDLDIKIQLGQQKKGAETVVLGDIVVIDVKHLPQKGKGKYKGDIGTKLGNESDPMTVWSLVKYEFGLNDHLEEIEVNELPKFNDVDYWVGKGYEDLTGLPFCTIDSYSSKDLDDALYVEDAEDEWKLNIAIADPTSIIEDNMELKALLVSRGVTHYLATEIIHLMAKFFSEDNFSLVEYEFRPALVATILVDKESGFARLVDFALGVIESKAKLSYEQVTEHIRQRAVPAIDDKPEIASSLNNLYELSKVRLGFRERENFVGLDEKEYFFVIDEKGNPLYVKEAVKTLAHDMVAEAAIAANIVFAEWADINDLPIAYVSHSGFKEESLKGIKEYLATRGIETKGDESLNEIFDIAHKNLYDRIKSLGDEGDEYTIALARKDLVELRGFYNKGEFTLNPSPHRPMGLPKYSTWTSPIRKSLDMLNHLVIKSAIRGQEITPVIQHEIDTVQERNRSSRQAERKLSRLLGLSYLKQFEGKKLDATLTQVLKRAVRFEFDGTGISTTLGVKDLNLNGFGKLDPVTQKVSVDDKDVLRISDKVEIEISSVDIYKGDVIVSLSKDKGEAKVA